MFDSITRLTRRVLGPDGGQRADAHDSIVHRLAESLQRQERVAGGWASEVGVLPTEAFEDEAERLVQAIALGGDQDGAPTP